MSDKDNPFLSFSFCLSLVLVWFSQSLSLGLVIAGWGEGKFMQSLEVDLKMVDSFTSRNCI